MNDAIVVQGVGKHYYVYHADRPWTLHETLVKGFRRVRPHERFWALRDVSFSIAPGRVVGIMGSNGSGKSTLLRLIAGVGRPDTGSIQVNQRIAGLLDLGTGFHGELTGRENIFVNGVIGGLTRSEVRQNFDSIVAFAELESFIDNPIRTYSTGMQMRLGFSIAIHTRPELLLIDEILSVGDFAFQNKCLARIAQFKADGCTILIVSHDVSHFHDFCDEAIWLHKGQLRGRGPVVPVVEQYLNSMTEKSA